MAIELGAAYISILPSTDKLAPAIKAELGKVEDESDRSGDRAGEKFGSRFKAKMGSLLKGGLLASVAGGAAGLGLGISVAAEMEQAEIAFTTMLGSGEKASSFIKDLSDFAAKTPFDFPGLQTAATSLVSAGIATKDVLPMMETLGDVTSGMGTGAEGIQRATVALQQMNAAGKVTGEDLNQLRDAGIPVYDLLSAAMGKSKAEVAALAQEGKLGAEGLDAIMSGLKTGTGLERFSGLMEKQSASLTGVWSTFKDTLGMGLAKAVTPLIPLLKDGLGGAAKILPPILKGVADALGLIVEGTISVVQWGKQHQTLVTVLGSVVAALVVGLVAYNVTVKVITAATKAWAAMQALLNGTMALNPIGLVVAAIALLVVGFIIAYKKSETFRNIVKGALAGVLAAGRAVGNFFTVKIPAAFEKVKSAASTALGWVKSNWPKILGVLGAPFALAVGVISKALGKIKSGALTAKTWVVQKFTDLIGFFRSAPGRIASATSGMWNGIKEGFRSAINSIIGMWNGLKFSVPSISIKGKEIFGGASFGTPDIPYLAKGGILTQPTLNVAGEAGPEAVIPLDRLDSMLRSAASGGTSIAEGSRYTAPRASSVSGSRRVEFVISNWKTGEGYFREIAEDTYHGENEYAGSTRRMR